MLPNNFQIDGSDERKREFKRQQDRLKMMVPDVERKMVSADEMINSLLQKSDTFKKVSDDLPQWILVDTPLSCPYYERVWNLVQCSEKMVDTQRISQLLLTSGLHPDVLGYIWNIANKKIPGQLTKQELFIVLALVGLAQSNCTFNNLSVLKLIPNPPIPRLHVPFQPMPPPVIPNTVPSGIISGPQLSSPSLTSPIGNPTNSAFNQLPTVLTINVPPDPGLQLSITPATNANLNFLGGSTLPSSDDDFQDFQSGVLPLNKTSELSSNLSYGIGSTSNCDQLLRQPIANISSEIPAQKHIFPSALPPAATSILESDNIPISLPTSGFTDKFQLDFLSSPGEDQHFSTLESQKDNSSSKEEAPSLDDSFTDFQSVTADDFSEFQDFQSAQLDTEVIQPPKVAFPKLSSFIKVSPESERKLRNLSQTESLSAMPESKISSRNKVSSMPSIAVLGGAQNSSNFASRDIGSRLANHKLGAKSDKSKHHHKHHKMKPSASINSSMSMEEIFPKVLSKPPSSFLLKETKIPSADLEKDLRETPLSELTRSIEIPIVGTFKETTLPVDMKISSNVKDSLGDLSTPKTDIIEGTNREVSGTLDKYSALREIEIEKDVCKTNEDFGEFLSASEKTVEAWTAWNSSVNLPEDGLFDTDVKSTHISLQGESFSVFPQPKVAPEQEQLVGIVAPFQKIDLLGDSFDLVGPTVESLPVISPTFALSEGVLSAPSEKENLERTDFLNSESLDDFGDFVGPQLSDISLPTFNLISGEDVLSIKSRESSAESDQQQRNSLSSHNFISMRNMMADSLGAIQTDDSMNLKQKSVAGKCVHCCHALLQEAVQIFEGVSDKSILKEVIATSSAQNYLKYLQVVHQISQRVVGTETEMSILDDINLLWKKLEDLAVQYNVMLPEVLEPESNGSPCVVCKRPTCDGDILQNGMYYHVSCANLWVNCIETSLPCF